MIQTFLVLLLMAGLLASFGRYGTFVLCFGEDGHVAVEAASAEHCCEPAPAVPFRSSSGVPLEPGSHQTDYPCGSCMDIPLPISVGVEVLPLTESRVLQHHQAVQPCKPFPTGCGPKANSEGPVRHGPSTYDPPRDLLSTTILLI